MVALLSTQKRDETTRVLKRASLSQERSQLSMSEDATAVCLLGTRLDRT